MINKHKLGLVFGSVAGLGHLVWSVIVAMGLAQPLVDFIFKVHFITNQPIIAAFSYKKAGALIVIAVLIGYAVGNIVGMIWNWVFGK